MRIVGRGSIGYTASQATRLRSPHFEERPMRAPFRFSGRFILGVPVVLIAFAAAPGKFAEIAMMWIGK